MQCLSKAFYVLYTFSCSTISLSSREELLGKLTGIDTVSAPVKREKRGCVKGYKVNISTFCSSTRTLPGTFLINHRLQSAHGTR